MTRKNPVSQYGGSNNVAGAWARAFTDEQLFRKEQECLGHVWTLLGLVTDIQNDGDWFRATLGTRSVFVQRFGNRLRGFANVCAHRFYPLRNADKGNGPVRCGFHHWQYNEEGLAVGIPKCKDLFGVTPQELGARLKSLDVETCGNLLFGRFPPAGNSETLEQFLGDGYLILRALTDVNFVPRPYALAIEANWKICVHITLDDYHTVAVHPDTFGKHGYLLVDNVKYFRFGRHSAFVHGAKDDAMSRILEGCRDGTYRPSDYHIFQLFPNLNVSLAAAARNYYVVIQQYVPVTASRTLLRCWSFPSPFPGLDADRVYGLLRRLAAPWLPIAVPLFLRKISREDANICAALQRNPCPMDGEPILGGYEKRIAWFEEAYDSWLNPVDQAVSPAMAKLGPNDRS